MSPKVKPIPDGYTAVTPYLVVEDLRAEIAFIEKAFGGKLAFMHTRPDGTPAHSEIRIRDAVLMAGQAQENWKALKCALYLYVEDSDAVYARALEAGATSLMPVADQPYGDRLGGVTDSQGIIWWISTHIADVSFDEMETKMKAGEH